MKIETEGNNVVALTVYDTDRDDMSSDEIRWLDESDPDASDEGLHPGIITYRASISPDMHLVLSKYRKGEISPALFFFLYGLADGTQATLYQDKAFDMVGELYSKCLNVLNTRKDTWVYVESKEYRITFEHGPKKMRIVFAKGLKGLLLGRGGSNADRLREFLAPVVMDLRID